MITHTRNFNKFHFCRRPWDQARIEVLCTQESMFNGVQVRTVMEPPTYVAVEPGLCHEPTMILMNEDAQQMVDALWELGIRPTGALGSAGQLDAVREHLSDMRKLVKGLS